MTLIDLLDGNVQLLLHSTLHLFRSLNGLHAKHRLATNRQTDTEPSRPRTHPTSHPKTWEIVHFGLRIANWLVGNNPPFAIRNPQCGGVGTNSRNISAPKKRTPIAESSETGVEHGGRCGIVHVVCFDTQFIEANWRGTSPRSSEAPRRTECVLSNQAVWPLLRSRRACASHRRPGAA